MSVRELEINRFGDDGDLLRSIRCLAGRVTVFRSNNPDELERYRNAIEGKQQAERFSILIDGGSFSPSQHIFIGFGPLDEIAPTSTVVEYLQQRGVLPEMVERILLDFGLGGLSSRLCMSLAAHEWKMLRLLAVIVRTSVHQVAVLHEPFELIPEKYREIYAERLSKSCWERQAIVIVTKLSFRPQSWIENDYIARVQLERPRQGTIGFGGGESAINEMIAQVRKESSASSTKTDLTTAPGQMQRKLLSLVERPQTMALVIAAFIALFGYTYFLLESAKLPQVQAPVSQLASGGIAAGQANSSSEPRVSAGKEVSGIAESIAPSTSPVALVADGYPPEIRDVWYQAIERPEQLLRVNRSSSEQAPGPVSQESPIRALYEELSRN